MSSNMLGSTGRWGIRYGQLARRRTKEVEDKQKQKQRCIFCSGRARRISKGIWECDKCGKKFAGHAYFLETKSEVLLEERLKKVADSKSKLLKKEKPSEVKEVKETKAKKKAKEKKE